MITEAERNIMNNCRGLQVYSWCVDIFYCRLVQKTGQKCLIFHIFISGMISLSPFSQHCAELLENLPSASNLSLFIVSFWIKPSSFFSKCRMKATHLSSIQNYMKPQIRFSLMPDLVLQVTRYSEGVRLSQYSRNCFGLMELLRVRGLILSLWSPEVHSANFSLHQITHRLLQHPTTLQTVGQALWKMDS